MALQASGPISLNDIYTELTGNATMPANTTLQELSDGTVATINTNSAAQPNQTPPYSIESWYGYDHSATGGQPPIAAISVSTPGTLFRTDKTVTLSDSSTGGTDRAWSIVGGNYTVLTGTIGNYAAGTGGSSTVTVTLDDPDKTYTCYVKAYNTNGTDTDSEANFVTAYLLEEYPGAKQAFSLRKLNTGITNCIKVRHSVTNTTQDIGFDDNGELDTAAILTFVGSNSAYIDTWYDQSGNGWNVAQATTGQQPRIVNAGTVDKDSVNNVALFFSDSRSDRMKGSTSAGTMGLNGSQNRTDYVLACMTTGGYNDGSGQQMAGTSYTSYLNGGLWRVTKEAGNRVYGGNRLWENSNTNFVHSDLRLGVVKLDGTSTSNMSFYYEGSNTAANITATGARTMAIPSSSTFTFIGNDYLGAGFWNGYIREYIVYATAHDDTTRGLIEDDIMANYT